MLCGTVAAECKHVVLPAGYVEVMREDIHQVLRQNSGWTLPGASELTTITALAGQTSHDILPRLILRGPFKFRSSRVRAHLHTGPNGLTVSKAHSGTPVLHELCHFKA